MAITVAINGFGRIGRALFRVLSNIEEFEIVAINDIMKVEDAAYLLKYDSIHGVCRHKISCNSSKLICNTKEIDFFNFSNPRRLSFGTDIVYECSGKFLLSSEVAHHIEKGAKKVIISAPPKDDTKTFVLGVNENDYNGERIISNASCTTNALAPILKIIDENFAISKGAISTIHSYTYDQNLLDNFHKTDKRRSRAAALNIIPTKTGATKSLEKVLPNLKGKFDGVSFRVPVADVSMLQIDVVTKKTIEKSKLFNILKKKSEKDLKNILAIDEEKRVSRDFIGSPYSAVVPLDLIKIIDGNFLKILIWYDNEWGYANRLAEIGKYISKGKNAYKIN